MRAGRRPPFCYHARMSLRYIDTRDLDRSRPTFTEAVVKGIADGGGLFVPERIPAVSLEDVLALAEIPYAERVARVFEWFEVDVPPSRTLELARAAYGDQWDDERIAPVEEVVPGMHVLELWHGPTSAFKDMALQCMPLFFSEAIAMQQEAGTLEDDFLVLVATSGDTGKAALEGFADREHTKIAVFYPHGGVSEMQRMQMVTQRGANVAVFGVHGNFDDCQAAVKATFNDPGFNRWLHEEHRLALSSANSINWGRLLPQIVYYVSAYAEMVRQGGVVAGRPIDVCVPTGNFGNILGAYYAQRMGVPIERLLCASNENNVLSDFIATGTYDISARTFVTTPSPSMDILVSSNLERLLFHLAGAERVRAWMRDLAEHRRFQVDRDTFRAMREVLSGDWVSNDESLAAIKRLYDETGYLMDPHTAVAWEVAERLRQDNPVLVVSTAHWAKFGADVLRALLGLRHAEPLPPDYAELGPSSLLEAVAAFAGPRACVPAALAELEGLPVRFSEVVQAGAAGVQSALRSWLGSDRI